MRVADGRPRARLVSGMATETVYGERGPKVGELFPNIVLPDQHGTLVGLHQRRGRAVIVFIRSARW